MYCVAISEYIQNHSPDFVTEKLNSYYGNRESGIDDALEAEACRLFEGEEWQMVRGEIWWADLPSLFWHCKRS